jgi:hypothetical protein
MIDLLQRLRRAGVVLTIHDGEIVARETCGRADQGLLQELGEAADDIMLWYEERAAIIEYEARMPRANAEAQAYVELCEVGKK